ncbi:L-methionine/branched-chain amino acid transporter [Vibrio neptunius]|uniref:L-methionine/branched-chain amino acid transporter n=1 Tax=Vibrio neptunius TaxID=170651 RepID=UPI0019D30719|nr:L-methionine/branched-chain amino acid transporter [Vibrio neptunius]MBN3575663.1 L-methionine/branched-chain amino acid transporter [Vibrio neptunius]QXX08972.1 L-methionine/branched-chain amino acid transporter [Vibrio neptunius]
MSQLKQEITLLSGIGQLSTTLLGTGLFMVPAIAAGIAGSLSLWAWLILFVAICPIALTFAQLGKRYPNAGGTAHFVRQAFDRRLEKSVAWLFVSVIPVGVPAAVALAAGFLQQLLPEALNSSIFAQLLTVLLLIAVNLAGTKSSGRLQSLIALSIFTLVAAFWWKGDVGSQDLTMPALTSESTWSIGAALAVMFWCFVGIEAFAHMGEEFKNPQRDFPIAIIIGCFVAGAAYWACSVVILKFGAYGSSEFDSASIPWLSEMLFGEQLKLLISVLGFAACFASVNLYTQSLSRMVWSQAREYKPQSALARVSVRGVPANATLAVGVVLILSCLVGEISGLDLEFFLKLANGIFVLVYLLAMLSACKLLTGISQWLAGLSLLICTGVFICLGWSMLYAVAVFALLSLPWGKRQTLEQRQAKERIE